MAASKCLALGLIWLIAMSCRTPGGGDRSSSGAELKADRSASTTEIRRHLADYAHINTYLIPSADDDFGEVVRKATEYWGAPVDSFGGAGDGFRTVTWGRSAAEPALILFAGAYCAELGRASGQFCRIRILPEAREFARDQGMMVAPFDGLFGKKRSDWYAAFPAPAATRELDGTILMVDEYPFRNLADSFRLDVVFRPGEYEFVFADVVAVSKSAGGGISIDIGVDRDGRPPRWTGATITGFDLNGVRACAPLTRGGCALVADPVADRCLRIGGTTLECEDCSVLCTRPID